MLKTPLVRVRTLVAALALSALPLVAAPAARAVEVPATFATGDTALVVWLDLTAINGETLAKDLQKIQRQVDGATEKADKFAKDVLTFRDQFAALGGQGVLFGMAQPAKDGDKPEPYVLLKTKPGADRAQLEKLIHGFAEQAKDNEQTSTAILAAKLEKYGTSTEWHALTGEELAFPPLNGTAANAAAFNTALKPGGKAMFQLCFRMLPKMKAKMKAKLDEQAKNPQQGDMMMGMMAGVMAPLVNLDTVVVVGESTTGARRMDTTAHFADAKSAKEFSGSVNGLIEMGKGMAGMQLAQMAKYGVDIKNANEILGSLMFKDARQDATLKLNDAFFTKVEKLVEQAQSAGEKMKAERATKAPQVQQGGGDSDGDAAELEAAENPLK